MKQSRELRNTLEILLVIGLIIVIPLFFSMNTAADHQVEANTIVPMPPTVNANAAEESNTLKPQQPPACTFPLAQITAEESVPEEYTFSAPQVVLTAAKGNVYNIIEWLPDNQQVLITENLRNDFVSTNDNVPQQSISLYNPETGESKIYAIRPETQEPPSWQPKLDAVVYPVMYYYDIDKKNRTYKFTRQIWISYGSPDTVHMLADNLLQLPFAIEPGGNEMAYLSGKQISKLDKSLKKLPSVPFDSAEWDYGKGWRDQNPVSYSMVWQPGTSLIFLYSNNYGGGGYTFILNGDTGKVCELNLGGSTIGAHWTSDGHYLALGLSTTSHPAQLAVLDTVTGKLTTLGGAPQGVSGQLYINDFMWAPDNHHLLAIGSIIVPQNSQNESNGQGLYLVNTGSGSSFHIADYESIVSSESNNWAWSPDGSKLLMRCPTHVVDQICLITVQGIGQ
jgi:hypothetical protein